MTAQDVQLVGVVPVIPVTDAAAAIAFYRDKLGFELAFEQGAYAGVTRGGVEVHLNGTGADGIGSAVVRIETKGVDALFADLEPRGLDVDEPLRTMPWGSRQFTVHDCCGNHITFVQSP